jgi:hypothetical protein
MNATSATIWTPLLECTDYEFQIKTTCTDSTRGYSESQLFRTKGCGSCYDLTYCDVSGTNSNSEWIDTIIVGNTIIGTGNNNGWLVYEYADIALLPGANQIMSIIPGYSGSAYSENFSVWIDLDQNGVFDPSDQLMTNQINNGPVTGLLIIPANAVHGITKMRVGMVAGSSGTPITCPTASVYGEFEDYCVYIGDDAGTAENENSFSVYPNPTHQNLFINTNTQINEVVIKSIDGKIITILNNITNSIDVSYLLNGIYLVDIKSDDALETLKFIKN